eukprot:Gb_41432 [translate_table: standard]
MYVITAFVHWHASKDMEEGAFSKDLAENVGADSAKSDGEDDGVKYKTMIYTHLLVQERSTIAKTLESAIKGHAAICRTTKKFGKALTCSEEEILFMYMRHGDSAEKDGEDDEEEYKTTIYTRLQDFLQYLHATSLLHFVSGIFELKSH